MFWGAGGVLDQLSAKTATCDSINTYLRDHIAYAPAQVDGPTALSVLPDTSLTVQDFVTAAVALDPKLESIVSALEQAANGGAEVDVQGGCGIGAVHIEAPELYGLAAVLETVRVVIQAGSGYDWGIQIQLLLDTSDNQQAYVDALNAHILHVRNAAALQQALPLAQHAVELLQKGITAASAITTRPANSLFDWTKMPAGTLSDLQSLAAAAESLLTAPGLAPLPDVQPVMKMDAESFFNTPVDMTNVNPPMWSLVESTDPYDVYYSVEASNQSIDTQLNARFSPDPYGDNAPAETFTLSTKWQNIPWATWAAALNPDGRWDNAYGCTSE
jgi:hypothetical protein